MITNHCKDPYFRGLRFVAGFRQIGPDPEEEVIRARLRGWPWG